MYIFCKKKKLFHKITKKEHIELILDLFVTSNWINSKENSIQYIYIAYFTFLHLGVPIWPKWTARLPRLATQSLYGLALWFRHTTQLHWQRTELRRILGEYH